MQRNSILKVTLTLLTAFCATSLFAQDPGFSQFYANKLYMNPAFAGTERCPRVGLSYREQWPGIDGNFTTYSATYDQHFSALKGGLGLLLVRDEAGAGTLTSQVASIQYSYQMPINRFFSIQAGAEVSYFEKKVDWSKLTFGDMIDARRGFIYETDEVPITDPVRGVDFSAGVLAYSEKYYGGFAVHHITEPDESLTQGTTSNLPRKITVHGGAVIPVRGLGGVQKGTVSPNLIFQNQAGFSYFNYGLYGTRGPVVGGLWFRHGLSTADALIVLVGIQQERYRFGYSYDISVSSIRDQSGGAHELSFVLSLPCRKKRIDYRTTGCPHF